MTDKNRRTMMAVTLGVWVAALGSAGALTYDLGRPLQPAAGAAWRLMEPVNANRAGIAEPVSDLSPVLYIPTITVIGQLPHRVVVTRLAEPATDVSRRHCAEWRELDMGSGQAEVCN
jgi:hypothetical protein